MITEGEHPVDIDRLLVVTFTNAAAAEMRERIGAAIEKALEEHPDSEHLQRQLTLIHNAQITTIDSFCLYVIRNHFHEIDLEPDFRIGDEGELKLLKKTCCAARWRAITNRCHRSLRHLQKGMCRGRAMRRWRR